ncbi:MAG: precorrin-6A/cobalt-precorrin-6A reductase [Pseudomonadota bacterium]
MKSVLVLGGTREAHDLADAMARVGVPGLVSLAGRAEPVRDYGLPVRLGGFGGVDGLRGFLRSEGIGAVLDATHPFADRMPWHLAEAAGAEDVPWAMLKRPAWTAGAREAWTEVKDLNAAAKVLPSRSVTFLATGAGSLEAFRHRDDTRMVLRVLNPPHDVPSHIRVIKAMPRDVASETMLFHELGITHLVAKNSGGPTRAKLDAAAALRVKVIMVARPPLPDGLLFETVDQAMGWLHGLS